MKNYKIRVANEAESKEAQELFFELGYSWCDIGKNILTTEYVREFFIFAYKNDLDLTHSCDVDVFDRKTGSKELTLPQLKDLVVLKRNDKSDRNVVDPEHDANLYLDSKDELFVFHIPTQTWKESNLSGEEEVLERLKPIEQTMKENANKQSEVKEYLDPNNGYRLILAPKFESEEPHANDWIEVPEGAEVATIYPESKSMNFWKDGGISWYSSDSNQWRKMTSLNQYQEEGHEVIWQRNLPLPIAEDFVFIDGFIESNIEQDNVNHPAHYSSGEIECIDAIQSSMTHESFCGYLKGNVQKYMWRYESKGGTESLKKAQWYLNKLIEVRDENSGKD